MAYWSTSVIAKWRSMVCPRACKRGGCAAQRMCTCQSRGVGNSSRVEGAGSVKLNHPVLKRTLKWLSQRINLLCPLLLHTQKYRESAMKEVRQIAYIWNEKKVLVSCPPEQHKQPFCFNLIKTPKYEIKKKSFFVPLGDTFLPTRLKRL